MKVLDELKKNGVVITGTPEIQVQNIVSTGWLGGLIDLEKTAHSLERCMYEPEQFPGLIYRMQEPKAVILLFANGKFVCTGSKKEEEIPQTITILKKTLEEKDLISHN